VCSVPVWVGIGHEIDVTVLDFVAHTSHKTPTAVAETLVERIRALDQDLGLARERLLDSSGRLLDIAQRTLLQNVNGLLQGSRKHLEIYTQRFQGQLSKLEASFESRMSIPSAHLGKSIVCLHERARALIELAGQELETAWRRTEEGAARNLEHAQTRCQQNL